jgi:hypothetical protein
MRSSVGITVLMQPALHFIDAGKSGGAGLC